MKKKLLLISINLISILPGLMKVKFNFFALCITFLVIVFNSNLSGKIVTVGPNGYYSDITSVLGDPYTPISSDPLIKGKALVKAGDIEKAKEIFKEIIKELLGKYKYMEAKKRRGIT